MTKNRRWILAILILLLLVVGLWRLLQRTATKEQLLPTLAMAGVAVRDIDSERIELNARVVIYNPLPAAVHAQKLSYMVTVNDKKIIESQYSRPFTVASKDSSVLEIPMDVLTLHAEKVLKEIETTNADSADYGIHATVFVDVPIKGKTQFKMNVSKRLPSFRIPKIRPEEIDLNKLTIKDAQLEVKVSVDNPNAYALQMRNVSYDIKLGDKLALHGEKAGLVNIAAGTTSVIPIQLAMKNKETLKLLIKSLQGKPEDTFNVDFQGTLVSKNKMMTGSKMAMHVDGTMEELKQVLAKAKEKKKREKS